MRGEVTSSPPLIRIVFGAAKRAALITRADRIGRQLGLRRQRRFPIILGAALRTVTKMRRTAIVPKTRRIIGHAVEDLEMDIRMFKPDARREFARILKPDGWAVLIWNERGTDTTPFLRAYEQLLIAYGTDYQQVRHEHTTDSIGTFFSPSPFEERVFDMRQEFDYAELEGRLLSSSYAPMQGHSNYEPMLKELRRIFDTYKKDGRVGMAYRTRMYYGQLS